MAPRLWTTNATSACHRIVAWATSYSRASTMCPPCGHTYTQGLTHHIYSGGWRLLVTPCRYESLITTPTIQHRSSSNVVNNRHYCWHAIMTCNPWPWSIKEQGCLPYRTIHIIHHLDKTHFMHNNNTTKDDIYKILCSGGRNLSKSLCSWAISLVMYTLDDPSSPNSESLGVPNSAVPPPLWVTLDNQALNDFFCVIFISSCSLSWKRS
jgi:hypothetical protein